jgi:ADP-ribosylglycohydrolase
VEFDKLAAIHQRFGPGGLRVPQYDHGQLAVSDDTQMTLFTLEGLTRAYLGGNTADDEILSQLQLSYLDWRETQGGKARGNVASRLMKHAVMHLRRSPEEACLSALETGAPGTPENPVNDSKGCGGVMRVAPVALMPDMDAPRAFSLGMASAALTHGQPAAYLPAAVLAATLSLLLAGQPLGAALRQAREMALAQRGHESTVARLDAALEAVKHPHLGHLPARLGQGWTADEALAIGLYAVIRNLDFASVLATAANQDGNSATAAAIAGQLYGAQYGLEALPQAWIRRLDVLDALCDLLEWGQPIWAPPAP